MKFTSIIKSTWRKALYSSLLTLPLFVILLLVAIDPYWPANIIGWAIVVLVPIILEILGMGYLVYIDKKKEEGGKSSVSRLLKILLLVLPIALALIIGFMMFLDYIKEHYFVQL